MDHRLVDPKFVAQEWPRPGPAEDKYSRGVLGVVAGSEIYPGAAVLSCLGALRGAAGVVHYVGPRRAQDLVLARLPEVIIHDPAEASHTLPRASAWLIGPGVADHARQEAVIGAVIASGLPLVVDAGAMESTALARAHGSRVANWEQVIFTPHAQELERTLGALGHNVETSPEGGARGEHARLLAEAARANVLLKGSITTVTSPGGAIVELPPATPWLATAGSGDVLAGLVGGLLAAGLPAATAGALGAWVHARAGELASGGGPIVASDIADAVPRVLASLWSDT